MCPKKTKNTIVLDYFYDLPKHVNKVGLNLSGGADSALILYSLAKISKLPDIYPIHGYDLNRKIAKSYEAVDKVVDYVRSHCPNVNIHDPHIVAFRKTADNEGTRQYLWDGVEYIRRRFGVDVFIIGATQGMPHSARPLNKGSIPQEDFVKYREQYPLSLPFVDVDKKYVASQYKELGIEPLSLLTVSCCGDDIVPCKTCWWCQERYWAFGNYDGGY